MSIHDEIESRKKENRLFPVLPYLSTSPQRRALLVTGDIYQLLMGPWENDEQEIRWKALRVDLDHFVEEGLVNKGYMKPLSPRKDEVWEILSRAPVPSMRVFGSFAAPDVFIATSYAARWFLMGFNSFRWQRAARRHLALWRQLFPTYPPMTGANIHEYVTENAYDNYHWRE